MFATCRCHVVDFSWPATRKRQCDQLDAGGSERTLPALSRVTAATHERVEPAHASKQNGKAYGVALALARPTAKMAQHQLITGRDLALAHQVLPQSFGLLRLQFDLAPLHVLMQGSEALELRPVPCDGIERLDTCCLLASA